MSRKFVALALAVSFVAMASSGMMMFAVNKTSFTLQMHPVHKLFGLVLVVAAVAHIWINRKGLFSHLKSRSVALFGSALTVVLVLLYGVAVNNAIPTEAAEQLDSLAKQGEHLNEVGH